MENRIEYSDGKKTPSWLERVVKKERERAELRRKIDVALKDSKKTKGAKKHA